MIGFQKLSLTINWRKRMFGKKWKNFCNIHDRFQNVSNIAEDYYDDNYLIYKLGHIVT
jgi:hypothetical protein